MKAPREILFARHRSAEPKLDAIRKHIVAGLETSLSADSHVREFVFGSLAVKLWRELIWSGRRAWAAYAAVWLVIVAVNLEDSDRTAMTEANLKPLPAGMIMALREQERLLTELMEQTESKVAEPPKPSVPRPRSQRLAGCAAV